MEGAAVGGFLVTVGEGERAGLIRFGVCFCEVALGILVEELEDLGEFSVEFHFAHFFEVRVFETRFILNEERGVLDDGGAHFGEVRFWEEVGCCLKEGGVFCGVFENVQLGGIIGEV